MEPVTEGDGNLRFLWHAFNLKQAGEVLLPDERTQWTLAHPLGRRNDDGPVPEITENFCLPTQEHPSYESTAVIASTHLRSFCDGVLLLQVFEVLYATSAIRPASGQYSICLGRHQDRPQSPYSHAGLRALF